MVTLLWSLCGIVAIALAAVCGWLWLIERRDRASLMLCILGVAAAASSYAELGLMHAATVAEYGEWLRWYHVPVFFAFMAQVLFVHYYLGTARLWLMWAVILARSVVLVVNFSVHPNFNFVSIDSLRHVSLLGEQVSVIGTAVQRAQWQMFALASLILLMAYLIDAAVRRWRKGGPDSRRKALTVSLGIAVPMLSAVVYAYLVVFGVLQAPLSNLLWFLGALVVMAYELGRDAIVKRRALLELTELREQLAQAERVSVLGQLASALAHELIQPLTATAANLEAARMEIAGEKPDLEELRAILEDVDREDRRVVEIITRMRQFSQRRAIELRPLRVEDVVQDVLTLVHAEATNKHAVVALVMQPDLPRVLGDRVHLSQVLLNLLVNSVHAVESRPLDARGIAIEARADDAKGEVELVVRDSGHGIPDNLVDEVFKPFFTTKSNGMGMGLALSRTIIEAHGGRLWTDRMPQQDGAVFRFTLKRA
ncbi:MAG TPA: ATP-binding protein [Dongiaceae bacterium]|nr:ATP-binding protein [Dongiaceae bacterium]